jgi:hypothetical protein
MKTLAAIALLTAAAHAGDLWHPLGQGISVAPSTLTAPTVTTRRVMLKVDEVVTLFEYDCAARTASMLYVLRPGREPYPPTNNAPQSYRADSAHGLVTRWACGRGMV